jgi:tetratricopeptide (TPR) repeat protein
MLELVYRPRGDLEAGMNFISSQVTRLEFLKDPYLIMDLRKNNFSVMNSFGLNHEILVMTRNLLDQAGKVMADSEKSFLHITRSRAYIDLGQFQAGLQAIEEALKLVQDEPIPYLLVYCYLTRFMVYLKMGPGVFMRSAKSEIDKAHAALLGHNIPNYVAEIHGYEAILDLYLGNSTTALEKAESAYRQFERLPFPFPEINLPYSLALYQNNRPHEAISILSNVYQWIQIVASKTTTPQYRTYWLESNLWNKNIILLWKDAQSGKIPAVPLIT